MHNDAILKGRPSVANPAATRLHKAFDAIKSFGLTGLSALFDLMQSEDLAVKTAAAAYSLHYSTEQALAALRKVASADKGVLGFSAEQAIKRWEEGEWNIR